MLDSYIRPWIDGPLDRLARVAHGLGLGPTAATLTGFAAGLAAALAAAFQLYWLALLLVLFNRMLDGLDGAIARLGRPTEAGGYLDIVTDFLVYAAVPLGFALGDPASHAVPAAVVIWTFIGTGSSFLAYAIFAERQGLSTSLRGRKSLYFLGGLTEGTETALFLVLICLLPGLFPVLAYIFAAMCTITAATRIVAGWQTFKPQS